MGDVALGLGLGCVALAVGAALGTWDLWAPPVRRWLGLEPCGQTPGVGWRPPHSQPQTPAQEVARLDALLTPSERTQQKERVHRDALLMLNRLLSEQQRQDLRETGGFCVQARSGRRYRLTDGYVSNVLEHNVDGIITAAWCLHGYVGSANLIIGVHLLSQYLLLSTDEATFCRIAHVYPQSQSRRSPPYSVPHWTTPTLNGRCQGCP